MTEGKGTNDVAAVIRARRIELVNEAGMVLVTLEADDYDGRISLTQPGFEDGETASLSGRDGLYLAPVVSA